MKCSDNKFIFNCNLCNNEYKMNLNNIINNRWCNCTINKTETKIYNWLTNNYNYTIIKQYYKLINNKRYYYDFYIQELNIILEIDGRQHFEQVKNWNSVEYTQNNDIIKMKYLIDNNISIIRILQDDVWFDKNNWEINLRNYLKKYNKNTIIFIDNNENLYNKHKLLLNIK